VIRTYLGDNPSFRELLNRVCSVALGAYAHQDMAFEKLVEELQLERDLSRNPLFQVMFVFQNVPIPALELLNLTLNPLEVDNKTAKFDLTLSLADTDHGLSGVFEYNTDLFDAATITRMIAHLQGLLESVIADPNQCLSDLALWTHDTKISVFANR
jgi:non-ribosomal peptide synthetase component F